MDNNEFNRRIRYALRLDDAETRRLMSLGELSVSEEEVAGFRCKEEEAGYQACPDAALLALLDGLILDRRGPPPASAGGSEGAAAGAASNTGDASPEIVVNNNLVLKQLRIALSLRSDDIHALITAGGGKIGKTEVGAFFRSPQARNYRRCGDQSVRWFLNGLAARRDE
ncbi:DUF1456 family protein [Granulosicoccus sp. 3-233]|uniref:DUF1456 family protein n=1 Tax=Granulosicoccus sp. 3-233 TaxID=3417969 RepID=UPI003D327249